MAAVIALGAALANAAQNLFIRMGTTERKASDAVFIVMAVNVFVLLLPVTIYYSSGYGLTSISLVSFIGAGTVGTLLGRMLSYVSIEEIGASRTAPIVAGWALVSTILGVIFLEEPFSLIHAIGIVLIISGIFIIAFETNNENRGYSSNSSSYVILLIPIGAAIAYGSEPIFAKSGFAEGTPAPVGLVVKTIAAFLGFSCYLWWEGNMPNWTIIKTTSGKWFVLGGFANTAFLIGYYLALEIAPVSIVTPIVITNTLFVVILSYIFMPNQLEHVTWKLGSAAVAVVVGVGLITVYG